MAAASGWLLNSLSSTYRHVTGLNFCPIGFLQMRNYAARKGTREKAKKKKVKKIIEKVGFIPHNQRQTRIAIQKGETNVEDVILDDSQRTDPIDNVWIGRYHKWKVYSFEEAVQNHRETHHPTMYNLPNAPIKAFIELDMQDAKKNKFVDSFSRIICIPHAFSQDQNRKILAFCKSPEMQNIAIDAGAHFAGGKDLIKKIQNGEFSIKEYDIVVSEPTILPDLLLIRGIMRKKFPNTKMGTLNPDIKMLVTKFVTGIKYTAKPHDVVKFYGTIDIEFGTLNMDTKQLEENFAAVVQDVDAAKPRRPGPFITRIRITCPPSGEMFKVNFEEYISTDRVSGEEVEDDEKPDAVIASH
ncbi:large ribosomal subunit protein uL1 [Linepithema humile]|uniref:large ribosomal subunit protein uL1 n=1 Tax=Linepithema humile TaxID=83485 RepID=UPI0006230042|nr:PREDICTED: 39S ribosomal protein L1, mitochondrial [Linepithema humile]